MRLIWAISAIVAVVYLASSAAAETYTSEQIAQLRKFDNEILDGGINCSAFEANLSRERAKLGLFTFRNFDRQIDFGIESTNIYLFEKVPEETLRAKVYMHIKSYQRIARDLAKLQHANHGQSQRAISLAEMGSAGCGRQIDAVFERTEWAIANGIDPLNIK